jgi:hypothetical protein
MKTKVWFKNLEIGQVLPIVVVSLFALIAMAALMIDGGMLLSHRRSAQAAADAGALSGARSLCPTEDYSKVDAIAVAQQYVNQNSAEWIELTHEKQFPDDNTIRVETRVSSQAFFARIFDQVGLTAVAAAEANCTTTGGTAVNMPIAFPCLEKEYDEQDNLIGCKNIKPGVLNIIMDSKDTNVYCYHEQDNPDSEIICDEKTSESSRGWLSLDGGDHGTIPQCWLNGDCQPPLPLIYPPTWLSRLGGLTNSDLSMLKNYYDREFVIPIYDEERENKPDPCPPVDENNPNKYKDDICILRGGTGHNAYRIIGFAQFTITCIHNTGQDQVKLDGKDVKFGSVCQLRHELSIDPTNDIDGSTSLRSIEGIFTPGTVSFGAGDGKVETGLYVVQLTK